MIEEVIKQLVDALNTHTEALNRNTEATNKFGPIRALKVKAPAKEELNTKQPDPIPESAAETPEAAPAPVPAPVVPTPPPTKEEPKITQDNVIAVANTLIEWDSKNDMTNRPGYQAIKEFNAKYAVKKIRDVPEDKYLEAVTFLRGKLDVLLTK